MNPVAFVHEHWAAGRRTRVLSRVIADLLPPNATVLDVGAGDGSMAAAVRDRRPDLDICGVDVLLQPRTLVPVQLYDGSTLPFEDGSFDFALLIEVLHHTDEPALQLAETRRVVRRGIVVKDHLLEGAFAMSTLRFMDWIGNARKSIRLPYNYWSRQQWQRVFPSLGLKADIWRDSLGIYPPPVSWAFDRKLHFLALLAPLQ